MSEVWGICKGGRLPLIQLWFLLQSLPEAALQIYIVAGQQYPDVGIEPDPILYFSIITSILSSAKNLVVLWLRPTMKRKLERIKDRSSIVKLLSREHSR